MRRAFLVCGLLLVARLVLANTCTLSSGTYATLASTAGHYTGTGCTGGSYVAGAGDSLTLANGVNLTIDVGETWVIGTSPASGGTAAVKCASATGTAVVTVNGTWQYRGPVQACRNWTIGAGALIQHDSSHASTPSSTHYKFSFPSGCGTNCGLTINGTSGSHVTWNIISGSGFAGTIGAAVSSGDNGQMTASYVDFTSIGNASTLAFQGTLHSAGATWSWDHVTLASGTVGAMDFGELADGTVFHIADSSLPMLTGSGLSYRTLAIGDSVTIDTPTSYATREILRNYIDNGNVFFYCTTNNLPHITVQGNFVYASGTAQNAAGTFSVNGGCQAAAGEFANNIFYAYDTSGSSTADFWMGGTTARTYFLMSSTATCNSSHNYHWINIAQGVNSVIDTFLAEPECSDAQGGGKVILSQGGVASNSYTVEIRNSIVLPANAGGSPPGTAMFFDDAGGTCNGSSTFCPTMNIHNNTILASNVLDVCGFYGRESTGLAGVVSALKDNLGWLPSAGAGCKSGSSTSVANGIITNADYNWWYNITSGRGYDDGHTADFSSPSPPGPHDTANSAPQFVDATRNFLKWCKTLNGADATWADCQAHFKAQTSGYTPSALIDYILGGFMPQNAAIGTASSTGSYVGAVQPAAAANLRRRVWTSWR
jgi:hypothetical protein